MEDFSRWASDGCVFDPKSPGARSLSFGPFRYDAASQGLFFGLKQLALTRQPIKLLLFLAERAGRLVSKEELLEGVWPGTHVTEGVLKTHLSEIRRVLGDDPRSPRFIATTRGRGYRFLCDVVLAQDAHAGASSKPPGDEAQSQESMLVKIEASKPAPLEPFIGRAAELAGLAGALGEACRSPQIVFVAGEGGLGKTALIDRFLASHARPLGAAVGRGRCHQGGASNEPYSAVLAALSGLLMGPHGLRVTAALQRLAPGWLRELGLGGALNEPPEGGGTDRVWGEGMLRELISALQAIAAEITLVLVLEDLHGADSATLKFCARLAGGCESARLLLVLTYQPVAAILGDGQLRRLRARLLSQTGITEYTLGHFSPDESASYLRARFPDAQLAAGLAEALHRKSDGNPLFLRFMIEELLETKALQVSLGGKLGLVVDIEPFVPESVRARISQTVSELPLEIQVWLECAAQIGLEFEAAAIAWATEAKLERVEAGLAQLAKRNFLLREVGILELPNRELTGRFCFVHGLVQEVLAERPWVARRSRLHRRLAGWIEQHWGESAPDHAARLAHHFELGLAPQRAIFYWGEAARSAAHSHAFEEMRGSLARALDVAARLAANDRAEAESRISDLSELLEAEVGQGETVFRSGPGRSAVGVLSRRVPSALAGFDQDLTVS